MTWIKKAGHLIESKKADEMITKYQKEHPDAIRSIYFDSDAIRSILDIPNTAGISIAFAKNEDGKNTLVIRPVDAEGNLLTASSDAIKSTDGGSTTLNVGNPCPPYCPK